MKTRIKLVPATTNNITNAIINFLLCEGHSASRINTQGQFDVKLGQWRKSGSRKGFFDIAACIKDGDGVGRFTVFDIKKDNDQLNGDQIAFIKEVEKAGGVAIEVRSYNEFLKWYRNYIESI